eukprot:Gb_13354 [translate_table: standard]
MVSMPLSWPRGWALTMASFSNTNMDDNLRFEIALLVEEAIRSPLEEIREAMGEMVQAIRSLHVANERRERGDESSDEEEGHRRPRDRRREANRHNHERNPFSLLERIPIPKFDGISEEIKPRAWIGKLSRFFRLNPIGDYQKIQFGTLHLEGPAFDWWQMMECEWDEGQLKSRTVDPAIIVDLRLKGLCFNYKEKWSKAHKCKTLGKIHMLEILNEEHPKVSESDQEELVGVEEEIANIEDQEQQEIPIVSLVTILGLTQYQTLRVRSKVKGRTMVALVYSGSTHNFIDSKLVSSTELKVELLQNFQVAVANDTMTNCKGMVRGLKLQLGNYELSFDFYVVALAGVDVVMGAEWLKTLVEFHMNLDELYIKLEKGLQLITVRGLKPGANRLISGHKITKQLVKGELCFIFQCNTIKGLHIKIKA